MLQKGCFGSEMGNFLTEMGNKCSNLPLRPGCRTPFLKHTIPMFCSIWDAWRGMTLGSAEIPSQLVLQPEPLFPAPAHSGEWRRDPAVAKPLEIPTRAPNCCWAEQPARATGQLRLPGCTDNLWEFLVPWGPSLLFFSSFLSFLFFVLSLFSEEAGENATRLKSSQVLPFLSSVLCYKRTCHPLVLNWHWLEQVAL